MWPLVMNAYECMYPLPVFKQEAAKKAGQLCCKVYIAYYYCVRVNTYFTIWLLIIHGNQIFMDLVRFLIYEVLYAWYLKYICNAWLLRY